MGKILGEGIGPGKIQKFKVQGESCGRGGGGGGQNLVRKQRCWEDREGWHETNK